MTDISHRIYVTVNECTRQENLVGKLGNLPPEKNQRSKNNIKKSLKHEGFGVLIRASDYVKVRRFHGSDYEKSVFWDVMLCGSCKNRRFGGKYGLHHQGDKIL
jgi:hypothetical protein